jgi:hypothetical protein
MAYIESSGTCEKENIECVALWSTLLRFCRKYGFLQAIEPSNVIDDFNAHDMQNEFFAAKSDLHSPYAVKIVTKLADALRLKVENYIGSQVSISFHHQIA